MYRLLIALILASFAFTASAQDYTQQVRENDKVYVIDISKLESSTINELTSIRYASLVKLDEGKTLVIRSSKDKSTKAMESILNLLPKKNLVTEKSGSEYLE